jgi:hypothetical protein
MTSQAEIIEANMEYVEIPRTELKVSRVAIGTWAIGGWMWGGTDEAESITTSELRSSINVVDTAPAYGFGRSEGHRPHDGCDYCNKVGLEWQGGKVSRNASRAHHAGNR